MTPSENYKLYVLTRKMYLKMGVMRALATVRVTSDLVSYAKELGFYPEEKRKLLRSFNCVKIILETVWRMEW